LLDYWKLTIGYIKDDKISTSEHLPAGHDLDWPVWRTLNRLRTGVGRSKDNFKKWGVIQEDTKCYCGDDHTMSHLLICPNCPTNCTALNLITVIKDTTKVVKHWEGKFCHLVTKLIYDLFLLVIMFILLIFIYLLFN
jgi:hypothetical protein